MTLDPRSTRPTPRTTRRRGSISPISSSSASAPGSSSSGTCRGLPPTSWTWAAAPAPTRSGWRGRPPVHLVDPVALQLTQAWGALGGRSAPRLTSVRVGDARELERESGAPTSVLLLGPLTI